MKKLSIVKAIKQNTGRQVIYLDFHNGAEIPTYETYNGLPVEVVEKIGYAIQNGYTLEYEDRTNQ